ncbi:F0F1 ATP synthase subunit A [Suipraeoptans intestinalis]|uniref:F0F1 ATP synthase subunit A n=1 Tax=Suipraeoptans intestinalis TaxID=2606628 RepID=UPI001F40842F|nr:F0F1 ATP synthase subunit A [Suipraeoptans intestinalis]
MLLIEYSGYEETGSAIGENTSGNRFPFVAPIMVLEVFIRPLSLCMRLFGNMLGGFVVMELIKQVAPLLIPVPLSFYFDIFDGLLQPTYLYFKRHFYE